MRPATARAGESLEPDFTEMTGMTSSSTIIRNDANPLIRRTPLVAGRTFKTGSDIWEDEQQTDEREESKHEKQDVSMRMMRFSPFYPLQQADTCRVGVPGHRLYPQSAEVLKLWKGSVYKAVFRSKTFRIYLTLLCAFCIIGASVDYTDNLRATNVQGDISSALRMLCIFTLTSFLTAVIRKVDTRFENVCKTNGFVTRLSAQAVSLYSKRDAWMLMRYTNSILHVYYELMSGPLDDAKWSRMVARGMLTREEVAKLQLQGSPGVILYTWAIKVLRFNYRQKQQQQKQQKQQKQRSGHRHFGGGGNGLLGQVDTEVDEDGTAEGMERTLREINMWATGLLPLQLNMEACIGGTRGLAAKQIAYTLAQFPSIYFQAVHVAVNMYLFCTVYSAGHAFARAMDESCASFTETPRPIRDGSGGDGSNDESNDSKGPCWCAAATTVVETLALLFVFVGLFKAADHLADAYGNKAYHYDLGVDLDGLWQESKNALKSMDVPSPSEELDDKEEEVGKEEGREDEIKRKVAFGRRQNGGTAQGDFI